MPWYLNEYLTDRARGGDEEGGWYYNTGAFVRTLSSHPTSDAALNALGTHDDYLFEKRRGLHPPNSVLCTGWPDILIEDHPGADYPKTTPVYE